MPSEAERALEELGIDSAEGLWLKLGTPRFAQDFHEIAWTVAPHARMVPYRLLELLVEDALDRHLDSTYFEEDALSPRPRLSQGISAAREWLRKHLPDFVLAVAGMAVLAGLGFALFRWSQQAEVLVAARPLAEDWILERQDLKRATLIGGEGLADPKRVIGRITAGPIAADELIRKTDLGAAVPRGSSVATLSLVEGAPELRPGDRVTLLVATGKGPPVRLADAKVLRGGKTTATFAIADLESLSAIPPNGRVLPVRRRSLPRQLPSPPSAQPE